jgi:hypothetical protein
MSHDGAHEILLLCMYVRVLRDLRAVSVQCVWYSHVFALIQQCNLHRGMVSVLGMLHALQFYS